GSQPTVHINNRTVRPDGTTYWTSTIITPVRGADGRIDAIIDFVMDDTDRVQQKERAMEVQRRLLPQRPPELPGYQLAGGCMPAQDMSGDFFDWMAREDGSLDLTLADVMGKGMGAALVMAAMRTAMRAAPAEMGPAERVRCAEEAMGLVMEQGEGLFVTVF